MKKGIYTVVTALLIIVLSAFIYLRVNITNTSSDMTAQTDSIETSELLTVTPEPTVESTATASTEPAPEPAPQKIENPYIDINAKHGDVVVFGNYEQDYHADTVEKDPIEWYVLSNDEDSDSIFLLSKYCLMTIQYANYYGTVTWETSNIRQWCNSDFLNDAFDVDEQEWIKVTHVTASKAPDSQVDPGNDTDDKVFLISGDEFDSYVLGTDMEQGPASGLARQHNSYNPNGSWWLRTNGMWDGYQTVFSCLSGQVEYGWFRCFMDSGMAEVKFSARPAIRVLKYMDT